VSLDPIGVRNAADLDNAISRAMKSRPQALLVLTGPFFFSNLDRIANGAQRRLRYRRWLPYQRLHVWPVRLSGECDQQRGKDPAVGLERVGLSRDCANQLSEREGSGRDLVSGGK
jgi:hypothetical protein